MKYQHIIPLTTGFAAFSLFGLPLTTHSNENDSDRNNPPRLFTTPTDDRGQIDAHGMPVERPVADRQNMEKPLDSSEVVGADILTHEGKEVGTVRDVYINVVTGEIVELAVSSGGFLGIGRKTSMIDPQEIKFDGDKLRTSLTPDEIQEKADAARKEFDSVPTVPAPTGGVVMPAYPEAPLLQDPSMRTDTESPESEIKLSVSDITGADVRNTEDQKIGSVDQVYLNIGSGTVAGLVISADQIPELEMDKIVLNLMELEYNSDDKTFIVHYSIDELRNAPRFIEGDYNVFQDIRTRMSMLLR